MPLPDSSGRCFVQREVDMAPAPGTKPFRQDRSNTLLCRSMEENVGRNRGRKSEVHLTRVALRSSDTLPIVGKREPLFVALSHETQDCITAEAVTRRLQARHQVLQPNPSSLVKREARILRSMPQDA